MKSVVSSLVVNVNAIVPSFVVDPVVTPAVVVAIVIVGAVESNVQANVLETTFPVPPESVNVPAATDIEVAPCPPGVNVAVYTEVEVTPSAPIVPPVSVMSAFSKLVVGSLEVNVSKIVASFVV